MPKPQGQVPSFNISFFINLQIASISSSKQCSFTRDLHFCIVLLIVLSQLYLKACEFVARTKRLTSGRLALAVDKSICANILSLNKADPTTGQ